MQNIKSLKSLELRRIFFKVVAKDEGKSENEQANVTSTNGNALSFVEHLSDVIKSIKLKPTFDQYVPNFKAFDENLSSDQIRAVNFAMTKEHFAIIQGPPGTGKTTVLIEIIRQFHAQGKQVSSIIIIISTNH